jgi:signal transduction histidine kinase
MVVDVINLRTRSVRFQVTALATVIVAVLLCAVAVALLVVQQRSLTAAVDEGLRRRADDLAGVVSETIPDSLSGADDDYAAQLVAGDGSVLVSSPNLVGGAIADDPGDAEVIAERHLADLDDAFRVLSRSVEASDERIIVHVATAADEISDSVDVLRRSLLVTIPLAVAALAATIWWLVGRSLQPVEAIRREVTEISEADLHRRVPVPDTDDEIGRLASTMNHMLDRLEEGVARIQGFAADASHELRSPLTRMRSELEVDLANAEKSDLAATHRSILEETIALQELVDDLLFLARSDAGRHDAPAAAVDLDDLVLAEAERLQATSLLAIDVGRVSAGQVVGDRAQLARALRNLVDNAARHARTTVSFELQETDSHVLLAVSDDGPGIPPEGHEVVFARFARLDEARSRDRGGSGLGLAIVRDVATRHGGSVFVDGAHEPGARFVVRLPRSH